MPFEKKGFLGEEAAGFVGRHRSQLSQWFECVEELNEIANLGLKEFHVSQNNIQQLTCISLYLRALGSFSAAIKLIEFGMSKDAGTIIRSQIESTIFLKASEAIPNFVETYHSASEIFRLKVINISLNGEQGSMPCDDTSRSQLVKTKENIIKFISDHKVKELNVRDISERVGLIGIYNSAHRYFSNVHTHSGAASLKEYLRFSADGEVEAILWGPKTEGIHDLMYTLCSCMAESFIVMVKLFPIKNDNYRALNGRFVLLLEKITGQANG
jgi:hypothetical protein